MPAQWGEWRLADVWLQPAEEENTGWTGQGCAFDRRPRTKFREAPMSFRTKLFLIFVITVLASVSLVAYGVTHYTQQAFEELDAQRSKALVAQFNQEFAQSGDSVVQQVENITNADTYLADGDRSGAAECRYLLVRTRCQRVFPGSWPRFCGVCERRRLSHLFRTVSRKSRATKMTGLPRRRIGAVQKRFLKREELPDGVALSLTAVRSVPVGR